MKFWRDTVVVVRGEAGGTTDPDTGLFVVADEDAVVYSGPANVQAGGLMAANRRASGNPDLKHDGIMFLPPYAKASVLQIEPDDIVHITYEPVRDGEVVSEYGAEARAVFVRPEDRAVLLEYR